jgi:hypothetical protein
MANNRNSGTYRPPARGGLFFREALFMGVAGKYYATRSDLSRAKLHQPQKRKDLSSDRVTSKKRRAAPRIANARPNTLQLLCP